MSDVPQVLLAHHLKALKLPTCASTTSWLGSARRNASTIRPTCCAWPSSSCSIASGAWSSGASARRAPAVKSLDSFDFSALPSLNKMLVLELARGEYVERRENVIALGNSGTGNSCRPGLAASLHGPRGRLHHGSGSGP